MVDGDIESHVRQMREISEGRAGHGDGSAYEQATRYYLEHLADACAQQARDSRLDLPPRVDLLICMTGMSPRPVVLAFKILRPARLVLITSDAAQDTIDVVHENVVARGLLRASEFSARPCVSTDPLSIYRIVREEVDIVARRHDGPVAAYIDITGGRKVMGASAALAAWQLNLGLSYVDGDYDPVLRQAVPGSDRMLVLDNPTSLFGEQEMDVATQAFASGNFEVARSRFAVLAERLVQPGLARFMAALSGLYRAWCDLDRDAMPKAVAQVRAALGSARRDVSEETVRTVHAQLQLLSELATGDSRALLLTFSLLDEHYRGVGRHDFAALFSYRTIEHCLSAHLKRKYGFACDAPDYARLTGDRAALAQRYRDTVNAVRNVQGRPSLPSNPGPFAAAVLLKVIDDPLAAAAGLDTVDGLRELERLAKARNASVLAHGEQFISQHQSEELNAKANEVLRAYWRAHRPGEELGAARSELAFVRGAS
ncbi:TIGR02710 family CRISPR-associated CARF protein [Dactylosporangium sucinum]|uniref:CRISPR-associated protein n=1 Tax=Dactylosporangium sucinum TaxID=1424081 RepID=A0A917WHB8_9ACTN|nr:TIGR02710 family CRISPR-associated CARF protein [Dactylosporangium sucinum]GGM03354.1 hypothetical protein GCM10007977_000870 [Dactylosporangium sucinum]